MRLHAPRCDCKHACWLQKRCVACRKGLAEKCTQKSACRMQKRIGADGYNSDGNIYIYRGYPRSTKNLARQRRQSLFLDRPQVIFSACRLVCFTCFTCLSWLSSKLLPASRIFNGAFTCALGVLIASVVGVTFVFVFCSCMARSCSSPSMIDDLRLPLR